MEPSEFFTCSAPYSACRHNVDLMVAWQVPSFILILTFPVLARMLFKDSFCNIRVW